MGNTCCADNHLSQAEQPVVVDEKAPTLKPATREQQVTLPSVTNNASPFITDLNIESAKQEGTTKTVVEKVTESAPHPVVTKKPSEPAAEPKQAPVPAPVVTPAQPAPAVITSSHYVQGQRPNPLAALVEAKNNQLGPMKASNYPALEKEFLGIPTHTSTSCLLNTVDQSTYQGQHRNNIPHGFGRIVYSNGTTLEGFFREGVPTGPTRKIHPNGSHYEGEFKDGFPQGKGVYEDDKGKRFEVSNWDKGNMNGNVVITSPSGVQIYKGEMAKNNRNGQGVYYDEPKKMTYTGVFLDNKLNGKGSVKSDQGYAYEGDFVNGIESGQGSMTLVDGRVVKGNFVDGVPDGECTLITDQGKTVKTFWKKGALISRI